MDLDPLSVVAPARVKALLLPVGSVRQSKFAAFVERLQNVNVVRLGDVSPDSRPHRTMFSPLAFPEGQVLYDLTTSLPPPSHLALAPFELYREPLVVVGIADGKNLGLKITQNIQGDSADIQNGEDTSKIDGLRSLVRSLEDLIDNFPKALVHQILVFDCNELSLPERIYPVPTPAISKTTTIKTVMCDLTSRLLAEMTTYARSLQGLPSLDSPRSSLGATRQNGTASAVPAHMTDLSRNGSSRSFSPTGDSSKLDHRTPMPTNTPSGPASGASTPDSRPTSPRNDARTPSPASFNEITGSSLFQSQPKTSGHDRAMTESRDRISVGGFGGGSLGERERNKAKGRIGVVVGAMYLLAGRWPDAVKELVNSATVARNSSDYLWHAKAMDYILVCLLMFAWAGMDFRIPENFFPGTEKPGSNASKSSKHSASNSLPDLNTLKPPDPENRAASIRALRDLLPDLVNNILNLYSRAWTFTDDKLPPLAFSQSAIRFTKLLSIIHLSNGTLDDAVLRHLVLNADCSREGPIKPGSTAFMAKSEIVDLVFRGYPRPPSESSMTTADYTIILAGVASVLSELGYHRKKALILRELMSGLLPALVQARKDGAAEMGVHPAASLASINATVRAIPIESDSVASDDSEQGMRHFISLVCHSYGIMLQTPFDRSNNESPSHNRAQSKTPGTSTHSQFIEATVSRALHQASSKASGSQDLKIDILRSCINICEALPDLGGALRYSAELLRVAGSGIAPGPDSSDGSPDLAIEEQVRLVNNISRTLSAARQLGFKHPETEYWDDFLVRGVEIVDAGSSRSLLVHAKSELAVADMIDAKKEKNPFIYNPFLKNKASAAAEPLLVAQEEYWFRVTLQNLFDFDVVVEKVKLLSDGVAFESSPQSTMIGPYRTQTILLSGTPQASGSLSVFGCSAKIKGCRERSFPTFTEPWALKADLKCRHVGLAGKTQSTSNAPDPGKSKAYRPPKGPTPSSLAMAVLWAQPNIILKSISAPQSAIMLLEGETRTFTITLQNVSRKTPVDLLLLSFDDSTAFQRQSRLSDKQLAAVELYELELKLAHRQTLRWIRSDGNRDLKIDPSGETVLEIEVVGKPGLSYGTIQVDYGHLGIPKAEIKDQFYTRKLMIPLTITVNASIDVIRNEIVALSSDLASLMQPGHDQDTVEDDSISHDLQSLLGHISITTTTTPHFLLLLDLRNSWTNPLSIVLETSDPSSNSSPLTQTHHLQPGTTRRIPLPFPRLYISNSHAPIPSLNPANKRQFVVSATKSSPEAERVMREVFWYREALLDRLQATWIEESTNRTGIIELRSLRLTPRMLSSVKLPDLDIGMTITNAEPTTSDSDLITQIGSSSYQVPTSTFLILHTHLCNRSSLPIRPLLRLQPALANQPLNIALDLNKKLLVSGVLQRALPALRPGEQMDVETVFLVLSRGVYEWGAVAEEIVAQGKEKSESGRGRSITGEMDGLGEVGRRTWGMEELCVVVAKDEDDKEGQGEREGEGEGEGDQHNS